MSPQTGCTNDGNQPRVSTLTTVQGSLDQRMSHELVALDELSHQVPLPTDSPGTVCANPSVGHQSMQDRSLQQAALSWQQGRLPPQNRLPTLSQGLLHSVSTDMMIHAGHAGQPGHHTSTRPLLSDYQRNLFGPFLQNNSSATVTSAGDILQRHRMHELLASVDRNNAVSPWLSASGMHNPTNQMYSDPLRVVAPAPFASNMAVVADMYPASFGLSGQRRTNYAPLPSARLNQPQLNPTTMALHYNNLPSNVSLPLLLQGNETMQASPSLLQGTLTPEQQHSALQSLRQVSQVPSYWYPGQVGPLHNAINNGVLPANPQVLEGGQSFQRGTSGVLVAPTDATDMSRRATERPNTLPMEASSDRDQLSQYQILIRRQLEYFVSQQDDAEYSVQGRRRQARLGQVGIRCKHCAHLPHRMRGRGAGYYPSKLGGVYQAAQNLATNHLLQFYSCIPSDTRAAIQALRGGRHDSSVGGGKQYWADACVAIGLVEVGHGDGLRFRAPVGGEVGST